MDRSAFGPLGSTSTPAFFRLQFCPAPSAAEHAFAPALATHLASYATDRDRSDETSNVDRQDPGDCFYSDRDKAVRRRTIAPVSIRNPHILEPLPS